MQFIIINIYNLSNLIKFLINFGFTIPMANIRNRLIKSSHKQINHKSFIFKNLQSENYSVFKPTYCFEDGEGSVQKRRVKSYSELLKRAKAKVLSSKSKEKEYEKYEEDLYKDSPTNEKNNLLNNTYKNKFIFPKNCFNKIMTQACLMRSQKQKSKLVDFLKQNQIRFSSQQNTQIVAETKHIVPRQTFMNELKKGQNKDNSTSKVLFKIKQRKKALLTKNISMKVASEPNVNLDPWQFQEQYQIQL